ncbi:Tetratricopeptide repeat-containing protein [Lutimaribacter pacificus]|uniref:Tetratricopeptide repeat-containing protein n=2 Tax=Lutimaribacter pacificus TaxID=391948 RepID=A0A1H0C7U5_9RHOB|nr:tetratricopeptide repeat protein [Lutimaribacter pacificus]SDN53922.1 Tetratricopeptide repeat-containing protein [Lutimaribacter pacificus]SHJ47719.1 Tetratricopeptide repeat-containing protein [Lutimaribacter pacificus]
MAVSAGPVAAQNGLAGSYLAARQAAFDADYAAAAQYFTRALARDPSNPKLLEDTTLSQLAVGELPRAVPTARKMEADGMSSQVGQMVLVADEVANERYDALLTRLDEEKAVGPLVDGLLRGWAHLGQGAAKEALAAFDVLAQERGLSGFALYHKALALAVVGDFESAEAIFAGDGAGPLQMTRRATIARMQILSQLGQNDRAMELLTTLFGPDLDPFLRDMRDRLSAGETLRFDFVTSPRDGVAEVFFTVAAALSNEAGDDYTLVYSRVAEFLRPDHSDALLLSAQLLENLDRFELAVETYKRLPRDHPSYHAAELGRAEALRRAGRTDAAVEVLEQLAGTHGDLPIVHMTLGDMMRQVKDYAAAAASYTRALELFGEPTEQQWFILYARAISYERQDMWEEAEADFRRALELNPEQPQVLNYLGYSLVEKQQKLDEALDMIERAVAARPDSGYIVDSLGWVLYRLGRYDEAVGHMERAAELMPTDPVVNDHLGDVYWAVDRKLEARFQWKRALSFHGTAETSDDVDADRLRRKLEVGLDQVLREEGAPPLKVANGD